VISGDKRKMWCQINILNNNHKEGRKRKRGGGGSLINIDDMCEKRNQKNGSPDTVRRKGTKKNVPLTLLRGKEPKKEENKKR
jgi:hypothetical protein